MKKHIALLLALFMLLTLAACGQEAAPSGAAGTESAAGAENAAAGESAPADAPEEAEATPEPEEETVLVRREVIVREYVQSQGDFSWKDPPIPTDGLALDRYTEYSYDEYGVPTEHTVWRNPYEDEPYADGLFQPDGSEWEYLDYRYDEAGELIEISGPYAPSYSLGLCTVVTEMKDGRPMRHTVKLDPKQMKGAEDTVRTYVFTYDAEGCPTSMEKIDYITISAILGVRQREAPYRDYFEYDTEGHLIRWVEEHKEKTEYSYDYSEDYSTVLLTVTKNGESTTSEESTASISGGWHETETAVIYVRVPLRDMAVFELSSLEDFYPELPDTLCGVKLPTPDGTRRLAGVTTYHAVTGKNIPILTEILYDEQGAPYLQLLSFGSGGNHFDNEEYDEKGRLIRMDNSEWGYILDFSYAEDDCSYTSTYTSVGGDYTAEKLVSLEDNRVPDLVRVKPETEWNATFTYTKDGLPERIKNEYFDDRYSYRVEESEDGSLCILFAENGNDRGRLIEFDAHGYLVYYYLPWSHDYTSFTYGYEDIP